jgi:heptosyltransferase I
MRVLIVRLGAFGDLVHTLPLAGDLAAAGHQIDWLCEDRWAAVLDGSPALGRIHRLPRKVLRSAPLATRMQAILGLVRRVRGECYDVVIDAHGLAKSAVFSSLSGGGQRVAHAPPRARELSWLVADRLVVPRAVHVVDQQRNLASALGVAPQSGCPYPLPAWTAERAWAASWLAGQGLKRPWMLNVGAGWPTKVWPHERLVEFTRQCAGRSVLLLWGSPGERTVAEAVVRDAGSGVLAPDTSIPQLAGLLAQGAVLVSGDTGPLHLARALETPAVGLFGPVPMQRNGPQGPSWRNLQAPGAAWERRDISKVAMGAITAEAVIQLANEVAR